MNLKAFYKKRKLLILVILTACLILFLICFYRRNSYKLNVRKLEQTTESIVLLAVGDIGTGEEMQYRVADAMEKVCRESSCSGVLILGDIMQDDGVSSLYDPDFQMKFEEPYKEFNVPFYMALGNHDYLGCVTCNIAYSTMSAKWRLPSLYYKQSFGNGLLDVFFINTEDFTREQTDWLLEGLEQSRAIWKVVAGHRPLTSHGYHGNAEKELKEKMEKTICNRATIYLSGHDHDLEYVGKHCGVHLVVAGGGGGAIRIGEGETDVNTPFFRNDYGFVRLKFEENQIFVDFFNSNGQELYGFQIASNGSNL